MRSNTESEESSQYYAPQRNENPYSRKVRYVGPFPYNSNLSMIQIPALILLAVLVGTTWASACLVRKIENSQPDTIALLPPGKMVAMDTNMVTLTAAGRDPCTTNDAAQQEIVVYAN